MATVLDAARPGVLRRPVHPRAFAVVGAATALVVFVVLSADRGPEGSIRTVRPVPEAHPSLWGFTHWIALVQIATLVATSLFLAWFLIWSRRHGRLHPALPVLGALFVMGLLTDSFANWTSSAAMNPDLLHYPTDWWFFSVSPTVEPLINTVAYPYLFLGPALAVVRLLGRRPTPLRHPRWTAFAITYLVALPINLVLVNLFMVRIEYWTYTQIPGWAAVRGGTAWQYPWTDTL
ncbi:MAG TPA: spirocyclase AveC family protein, partial [Sporichthyaceae bacterium]|nr:spirocyclase AveC family protein [Sporichthyaceae bacterium]